MNPGKSPRPADASDEVSALIETLHRTGQRLEELTAGEVDAVADRDGRTFLLRRAQEQLRHSEAAKQAAILNALPAHVALLDAQGRIISVNEAWRRFADANALRPGYGIGLDYLAVCDSASGDDTAEAQQAAAGIRSVLDGTVKRFFFEYPCHSSTEQRWFLMTVTPLADDRLHGVVVMHLDLTAERLSEERYRLLFDASIDAILLTDTNGHILAANPSACRMFGWTKEEILKGGRALLVDASDPRLPVALEERARTGSFMGELAFVRKGGATFPGDISTSVFRDKDGHARTSLIIRDITARKAAEAKIHRLTQLYAALSQCNEAIVRCTSENELFVQVCRAAVQFGGAKMAWVGLVDTDTLMVRPAASYGDDTGYLGDMHISVDADSPVGGGPTGTAIREKQPFWCQDFSIAPATVHWRERAVRAGFAASASLPLYRKGVVVGAFSLYSGLVEFFDELARDLLVEMSTGISFALDNFARESQRVLAEEVRQHHAAELEESQRIARIGSWEWVPATGAITWSDGMNHVLARDCALPPPTFAVLPQFFPTESWQRLSAAIARTIETGAPYDLELEMIRADGAVCWTTTRAEALRGADGTVLKLRGTVHDITDRKNAESRISYLNRVYALLSGINALIVRACDRDEMLREACRIAIEQGGFRMALIVMLDRSAMKLVPIASAGMDEAFLTAIKGFLSSSQDTNNTIVARAIREKAPGVINDLQSDSGVVFGKQYAEYGIRSMAVLPLLVADEAVGVLALYANEIEFFHEGEMKLLTELAGDISFAIDHIDKQARLDYLAYYDVLTGLANRSLFLERLAQYMRSAASGGHKLAVFLVDLERFKNINDSLGRTAGDALLRQVAEWLTRNAGDANLLARIGADHFALVLPQVRQEGDVIGLLEKRMDAFVDHPFRLNDAVFRVAVKVGVAVFPDDGADADILFRNAEAALKKAKASGERYLFYTQKMTDSVAGKLSLENQLRLALDDEEFVLHYQPKVNLVSGKMSSAEALIRWNDPRTGLVPPGRFIPILEETGMIYDVGRWALKKAIEDYLRWRAAGLPAVRIAVNVSPLQLRHRGFIDEIGRAIGIDSNAAAGLELEITESVIMADVKGTIASLQAIRALGVTVAIDDFGTGFSSLAYLAKLPVDALKIDRSFVLDMTTAPEGLALVSTIIKLAHSLKLTVVAEGVETEEQARLLRLLACDEMQGFLFSKPIPSELFETRFLVPPAIE